MHASQGVACRRLHLSVVAASSSLGVMTGSTTTRRDTIVQSALQVMHESWKHALTPVAPQIVELLNKAVAQADAGRQVLPAPTHVLRAFSMPLDAVKVVIVGQDPYPTPGHPVGLSFSVASDVRPLPRSLQNIYRELHDDVGVVPPQHGDLSAWHEQGVLLLNTSLTVEAGSPSSHAKWGWQAVTSAALSALAARGGPLAPILWGRHAQKTATALSDYPSVVSAHPSPLSASRGFFGSKPFSRTNDHLHQAGASPVIWDLPEQ